MDSSAPSDSIEVFINGTARLIRYSLIVAVFLSVFCPTPLEADEYALGLIFVEPTGISGKLWMENASALTTAWGMIPGKSKSFRIHADYLLPSTTISRWSLSALQLYFGAGVRFLFQEGIRIGVRIPVGLEFISSSRHTNFFLEVVPIFQFNPKARLFLRAGIGLRYFFPD